MVRRHFIARHLIARQLTARHLIGRRFIGRMNEIAQTHSTCWQYWQRM